MIAAFRRTAIKTLISFVFALAIPVESIFVVD
jgi:hypothetical protein